MLDYRAQVDDAMLSLIGAGADREFLGLLALGLNHEQQHQELMMTDVKHLLSCNPLGPAYLDPRHRPQVEDLATRRNRRKHAIHVRRDQDDDN